MKLSPGELSQRAFEASITHADNARELADQAAQAYADEQNTETAVAA